MFKKSISWKADCLHSDVRNLELPGFYDSFLIYFKIPSSRVVGLQAMIGRGLAYYSRSHICLVFFYLLLVSSLLLEARRKPQDTSRYGHVSIARLSIKHLSFPLLLRFFRRKHNTEDTIHHTHTFILYLPLASYTSTHQYNNYSSNCCYCALPPSGSSSLFIILFMFLAG